MSMYLCRKVCCCCYAERKVTNPVTLTRAETITVQPTTSAALEMHQVTSDGMKRETPQNKKVEDDKLSITSDMDEIDLNEQIPTDEDLQLAQISTPADQSFAAAVTDMMLDEINDHESEKEEISEEPVKIDNNVIAEATDEEVHRTLTRSKESKPIVEKLNFEELSPSTGYEVYKEKKAALVEQPSLPSPEKPPRHVVSMAPEPDIEDKMDEEKEIQNMVKVKENLVEKNKDDNNDPSLQSLGTEESDMDSHTPEISHLESESTEAPRSVPLIRATEMNHKIEVVVDSEEEEEQQSIRSVASSEAEFSSIKKTSHGNIKDENAKVEVFENREVIIHDNNALPSLKHRGQMETSKPPESYPRSTSNMYGNISDSDESESSESEAESLDVPRKKPNRVSVKQTNVVLTKVTAVDAPPSETSETDSFSSPRERNNHRQNNLENNYVVLTDEEFSEKVI